MSQPPKLVNAKEVIDRFAGDRKLIRATFEVFKESATTYMSEIEQSILDKSPNNLKISAHALKGSVALFSSGSTYEDASKLENMAAGAQDIDWNQAKELLKHLEGELLRMNSEVIQLLTLSSKSAA